MSVTQSFRQSILDEASLQLAAATQQYGIDATIGHHLIRRYSSDAAPEAPYLFVSTTVAVGFKAALADAVKIGLAVEMIHFSHFGREGSSLERRMLKPLAHTFITGLASGQASDLLNLSALLNDLDTETLKTRSSVENLTISDFSSMEQYENLAMDADARTLGYSARLGAEFAQTDLAVSRDLFSYTYDMCLAIQIAFDIYSTWINPESGIQVYEMERRITYPLVLAATLDPTFITFLNQATPPDYPSIVSRFAGLDVRTQVEARLAQLVRRANAMHPSEMEMLRNILSDEIMKCGIKVDV